MCDSASYMKMTRGTNKLTNLHTVHKTTHRLLRTTATTPSAERHMQ